MLSIDNRDARWSSLVSAEPAALPYHHSAWSEVVSECYGYRPFVLASLEGDRIRAALPVAEVGGRLRPRRWVSLPFTDYCPPLTDGQAGETLSAELDAARKAAGVAQLAVKAPLEGQGAHARQAGVMHALELTPDPDEVFRRQFRRSQVGRNIVRAEREGVVVRRGSTAHDLTDIYYALHVRTRRRLGAPAQPRRFFELLWERMLGLGFGFVLLASVDGRPIAGAVFLAWNETVVYKFGASEARFWSLRPNHLLFWRAVQWASEQGFRRLDFGRTELEHRGLLEFKRQWATTEEALVYTTIGEEVGRAHRPRAQAVKSAVIRRAPPVVARLWGELFYRYAA